MATTKTPNKDLNKIGINDLGWGTPINDNEDYLDKALGSAFFINASGIGPATVVLTKADVQNMALSFSGLLGNNINYQIPAGVAGQWVVINKTTGAFTLTISHASGGAVVVVPQGTSRSLYTTGGAAGMIYSDTPIGNASTDKQILYNDSGNIVGSALFTYDVPIGLTVVRDDANNAAPVTAIGISHTTTGIPAVGIGVGIDFSAETAAGVAATIGARIRAVATAIGAGAENFDFSFILSAAGAMVERFRITSAGAVSGVSVVGAWLATLAMAQAKTDNAHIMTPLRTYDLVKDTFNIAGAAPCFAVRAWCEFGAGGVGLSVAIRGSGNIASVTKVTNGVFDVVFTTNMQDANYAVNITVSNPLNLTSVSVAYLSDAVPPTASGFRFYTVDLTHTSSAPNDPSYCSFIVVR